MLSTYLENLLVTGLAQSKEDTVQAQQWAALNLRHVELRPIKAIARVLSVSPRSVSRLLSRGLHLVARELVRQLKKHADEASRSSP
jgi:DNA-directed RNA polymerase specialized sigma24 family protein